MKTIFSKLMLFSIAILLLCTIVISGMQIFLIDKYVLESRVDMLVNNAERISKLTEFLSENYNDLSQLFYMENLNTIASSTETYIVLTDTDGAIMKYSSNTLNQMVNFNGKFDVKPFKDVLSGETVVLKDAFNEVFGRKILTVASPLKTKNEIYGIVFINYPIPKVNPDSVSLMSLLLMSIGISAIVSLIFSYFVSQNLSKPIKNFCGVAQEISRGEFDKRSEGSDIKEINELSQSLNTMAMELEKTEQARADFISNVSHDLRTPMTSITGFVDGILDGTIPKERQEQYLTIVSNEAKRLSHLVDTFLDTSRYDASEIKLNISSFNICEMIGTILINHEQRIEEKNLKVSFKSERNNIYTDADEPSIHRIITNLVDNATKFAEDGGEVNVSVSTSGKKCLYLSRTQARKFQKRTANLSGTDFTKQINHVRLTKKVRVLVYTL